MTGAKPRGWVSVTNMPHGELDDVQAAGVQELLADSRFMQVQLPKHPPLHRGNVCQAIKVAHRKAGDGTLLESVDPCWGAILKQTDQFRLFGMHLNPQTGQQPFVPSLGRLAP